MDPSATDESLLASFLKGERAALGELARRYEGPLLGLATALLDGRNDMACDAIQETWVRVIRFGARFNARSTFKTWLYRIAINQCRTVKSRAGATGATGDPSSDRPCQQTEPGTSTDDLGELREVIRALTPDRRIVVLLCFHAGMTHQHASEILGLPLGTLKTRLRAAMTDLRARLLGRSALRADTELTP